MNSDRKVNTQHLTEKNRKILHINNINMILNEFGEYQVLTYLIKKLSQNKTKKIKKILIIGEDLLRVYPQLNKSSPDAQYYITSKSNDILKSFIQRYNKQQNYSTHTLNVFEGVSLLDFTYYNGKFDLVIVNKIYSQARKKKRYLSARFLYKHYLRQYGILCIINYTQNSKGNKSNLLRTIKPALEKKIPTKNKKGSIHFIFYVRRRKFENGKQITPSITLGS